MPCCVECETNPVTPGHFCECCGRRLSEAEKAKVKPHVVSSAVCGSCGAPAEHGDLCRECMKAFGPVLGTKTPDTPPEESAKSEIVKSETAKLESARLEAASGSRTAESGGGKQEAGKAGSGQGRRGGSERWMYPTMNTVVLPDPQSLLRAMARPNVPAVQRHRGPDDCLSGDLIFVALAASRGGIVSLKLRQPPAAVADQPAPSTDIAEVQAAPPPASPRSAAPVPAPVREAAPAARRSSATATNRPAATAPPPAVKANVERVPAARVEAPVSTRNAVNENLPVAVAPAPRPVAVNNARVDVPEAPRGPLFDPSDVNESPKIATRVETLPPRSPESGYEDVVIVRRSSPKSRSSRLSLLRRSRSARPSTMRHWRR